ncbi:PucR family transcriptional regulator [Pseudonocardia nigra]|uniref:PucR family transcriptional regulator n=1 Tax=Pseudonocardia nigra TaxID=1921578 RepID=UPI001C5F2833|nr:helix-turn-helix domain-containing protein [Pseudonocardia nigra]
MDEVQTAVDDLAARLGRSVCVEEPGFRPLAVSAHYGVVDPARVASLLSRRTDPALIRHFAGARLDAAAGPVRIDGNPGLELLPRLVVPVRQHGWLLGHIWLIDAEPPVGAAELTEVQATAARLGQLLWRRRQVVDHAVAEESAMLLALLDPDLARRRGVLEQLLLRRELPADAAIVAVTAGVRGDRVDEAVRLLLADARQAMGPDAPMGAARDGRLVALAPVRVGDAAARRRWGSALRASAARSGAELGGIGLGSAVIGAQDVLGSLEHASYAARIADRLPERQGMAAWDDLGHLRMFASVPWDVHGVDLVHPGASRLLDGGRDSVAATLLTYLDHGGSAQSAAAALNIHRTTLYYRLGRARELLGTDVGEGEARLGVHAALVLARLAGLLS